MTLWNRSISLTVSRSITGFALIAIGAAGVLWPSAAMAQETISHASVSGRVTDPQGAVVPGAQVSARHTQTNVTAETVTTEDGRFRFPYLKVGPYEVRVHLDGFRDVTRSLTLTVGAAFDLPISLAVGSVDTTVMVNAEAPVLEAARTQMAATVTEAEVAAVPMNGRNFLDLALLMPGVSPTNVASTQLFAETSAVPGSGLSIGSQRNFSNSFIVDGLSANDDAAGLSGMPYGADAVDQFQVVTSGGQAEFGRALGGYINVVTKSGTNTTRGHLYGFFRDDGLNAPNPLTGAKLPMTQQQYGVSAGGAIRRDRTFYFSNVEQRRLDQFGLTTILPSAVNAITARLTAAGYPGSPIATGLYPNPVHTLNALGKIDHWLGSADQITVRYSAYRVASDNSRAAGGLNAPSASAGLHNVDHAVAFSNTLMLSPRTVNETRAQFAHGDLEAPPTDPVGPAVNIAGVAAFGTMSGSPTGRLNRTVEVVDNISHQAGSHALRAGIDVLYNDNTITYPRSFRGAYTFSSLANFMAGVYNNAGFTQTFGASEVAQTNPNIGVYVQDEWAAGPRLTVNAGLRYDLQFLETIATDDNNVAPRLGLAWLPSASRRTVLRASAGLFFDRVPLRPLANALLSAGNTTDLANLRQISLTLSPAQTGAPAFPNILPAAVPSVTLVNFTTMDRHLHNAYSRQASVEIEQQVGDHGTISLGYDYTRSVKLLMQINQNVPSCVAAGANNGCRPNSAYANNNQYSSAADSVYHGFRVSLVQRPTRWGHYRVSYTLSKARDNVGEFFFSSPIDPHDLSKDWGRSDDDQRHRLVVTAAINSSTEPARTWRDHVTHRFQVSGLLQYYSALPFNITSGVTTVQGTPGRPIVNGAFIPRNAGAGPAFLSLGMRVSRSFRLTTRAQVEVLAEVFNLTNHRNVVTLNGNFGAGAYPSNPSATFGQVTSVGEPRTGQVGVRVRF